MDKLYDFYPLEESVVSLPHPPVSNFCHLINKPFTAITNDCKCSFCTEESLAHSVCCHYVKNSQTLFATNWNIFLDHANTCFGQNPKVLAIVNNLQELQHFIRLEKLAVEEIAERRNDVFKNAYRTPIDDPNAAYRYASYRKLTKLVHGSKVKGVRVSLPSCVVSVIRKTYPSPNGDYTGFQDNMLYKCIACKLVVFHRNDDLFIRIPRKGTQRARRWAQILEYNEDEYSSFPEHSVICPSHIDNQSHLTFDGKRIMGCTNDANPKKLPYKLFREIVNENPYIKVANANLHSSTSSVISLDLRTPEDGEFISPSTPTVSELNQLSITTPRSLSISSITPSLNPSRTTPKRPAPWNFLTESKRKKYDDNDTMAIISLSKLMPLFNCCFDCSNNVSNVKKNITTRGTAISVYFYCSGCKTRKTWHSQDLLENQDCYIGNTKIISAAFLTPINSPVGFSFFYKQTCKKYINGTMFQTLEQFFSLAGIIGFADRIFKNETKKFVIPEVEKEYLMEQKRVIDEVNQSSGPKIFAGDAQYDSPGFCAENACYTITDTKTGLAVGILAKNKKISECSSQALEPLAMEELIKELVEKGLDIDELVTDRSKSVTSRMEQKFPNIKHLFDAWHVIKGIKVEWFGYSKTKKNSDLKLFMKGLLNHLWHSLGTARENPEKAREVMLSCLFHLIGKHDWQLGSMYEQLVDHIKSKVDPKLFCKFPEDDVGKLFKTLEFKHLKQCFHPERRFRVLDGMSTSFFTILKTLTRDKFLIDFLKLSHEAATSRVECFNAICTNIWRPKRFYFPIEGFRIRSQLAYLHFNNAQRKINSGETRVIGTYKRASKVSNGENVHKKRHEKASIDWKHELIANILKAKQNSRVTNDATEIDSDEDVSDDDEQSFCIPNRFEELLEMPSENEDENTDKEII